MALPELTLYGFLSLIMARISSIDYRFDSLTSNIFFLCNNSNGTIFPQFRSFSIIPL